MVHSYTHRVESMAALQFGEGHLGHQVGGANRWNVFSLLEIDYRSAPGAPDSGVPSMVGNAHVPPNGIEGYDYDDKRRTLSFADQWRNYPDCAASRASSRANEWGNTQFGYQKWILEHLPKGPGATKDGVNKLVGLHREPDEDLPEWKGPEGKELTLPVGVPEVLKGE
jgi:hypothetical protein